MKSVVAMLLAGGRGSRLNILAMLRAKPAVTFGGIYRIIDFTLSNIVNSNIFIAGILTQYKPFSLMKHVGTGVPWDFIGRNRSVKILPPATGMYDYDWYQGTADAIHQNISFIERYDPAYTLVLSGDHIYHMNYNTMIDFHKEKNADVTVAMMKVPLKLATQFGIGIINSDGRLTDWEEKPENPRSDFASMGIYVFNTEYLKNALNQKSGNDFGKDIIPGALKRDRIYAFPFKGYWQDVGTLQSFWDTNMEILDTHSNLRLNDWNVRTNVEEEEMIGDRSPSYISGKAVISNSLISPHCIIEGTVVNSILSPGIRICEGAIVRDSIIMHDCVIEKNSQLDYVIMDKECIAQRSSVIGWGDNLKPNEENPSHLSSGLSVVGKKSIIPAKIRVGRNCIIHPLIETDAYKSEVIECGSTVKNPS
ncbi:MAG: sugar phosphate nucleotidyltransferase [candidate division KSB1 bacterium]|jgi:glucose-1-phosphate adenylyltransferase|nr:sugar phosphate nucleotidyltransferase [candidate division KSB1 bacterium]